MTDRHTGPYCHCSTPPVPQPQGAGHHRRYRRPGRGAVGTAGHPVGRLGHRLPHHMEGPPLLRQGLQAPSGIAWEDELLDICSLYFHSYNLISTQLILDTLALLPQALILVLFLLMRYRAPTTLILLVYQSYTSFI